jgi:hypothetical protein|tara:strand:+ start:55 stop:309 length:255 start_codon:yes stop_codon:yes gene_type:complete
MVDNNDITNELNIMTRQEVRDRASDKAFAKIEMLSFQIRRDAVDLDCGYYGGDISREQFILITEGNKTELKTWNYIATLIEKDE